MNTDHYPVLVLLGPCEDPVVGRIADLARATFISSGGRGVTRLYGVPLVPDAERRAEIAALADAKAVDCVWVKGPRPLDSYRLAVMDMDSTLIENECIDELADFHGVGAEVKAITAAAMRGEIPFAEALHRRVMMLRGLPEQALQRVQDERIRLSPGVEGMLAAFREAGLATLVASGGFTFFAARLASLLCIDEVRANTLVVRDGRLTGELTGPVMDATAKRTALLEACARLGATSQQVIAIGDGANDIPMMSVAGASIAYRAKPEVRSAAMYSIDHAGLGGVPHLFFCPEQVGTPR